MTIINTYHVPVPVRANAKGAAFLAVLTVGATGNDYAVYLGIVGGLDLGADGVASEKYCHARQAGAEWVESCGQKLPYRKALAYFPDLKESEYRA